MAKAKLKTEKTEASVKDFIKSIVDNQQRKDSAELVSMMEKATGEKPKMWGSSIIGFGNVNLKYDSGRELDWFTMGFSPRKQSLVLYGLKSRAEKAGLLSLGKVKAGKGCLYVKKLEDIDRKVLEKMLQQKKLK